MRAGATHDWLGSLRGLAGGSLVCLQGTSNQNYNPEGHVTEATGKGGELAWCPQKNLPTLQDLPNAGLWGHLSEILGHTSAPVTVSLGLGVYFSLGFRIWPLASQLAQYSAPLGGVCRLRALSLSSDLSTWLKLRPPLSAECHSFVEMCLCSSS